MLQASRTRTVVICIVVACLVVAAVVTLRSSQRITVTASFENSKSIYVGDDVMVMGVPVGKIVHIEPGLEEVEVEMEVDKDVEISADARAAVVSKSLVSVRSVVLGPTAKGGPTLSDGDTIPISRTAVPVEYDEVKDELVRLTDALGPRTGQATGAAGEFLDAAAGFLDGQGVSINQTLQDMSAAAETLSDNKGNIFGTVRNLEVFVTALEGSDQLIRDFETKLADASAVLDQDRQGITDGLASFRALLEDTPQFFDDNGEILQTTIDSVQSTTSLLVEQRQGLADLLQVLPHALSNFANIADARAPALTGQLALSNFGDPAYIVCGAIFNLGGTDADCQTAISPLVQSLVMGAPPIGATPLGARGLGPGKLQTPEQANLLGKAATSENGFAGALASLLDPDLEPAS